MIPVSAKLLNQALTCLALFCCTYLTAIKSSAQDETVANSATKETQSSPKKYESQPKGKKGNFKKNTNGSCYSA